MPKLVVEKLYEAYETTDERGGRGKLFGLFHSKDEAKAIAKNRGWYGGDGGVSPVDVLRIDDNTAYILRNPEPVQIGIDLVKEANELRTSALTKLKATLASLSPEERKAIAMDENKLEKLV